MDERFSARSHALPALVPPPVLPLPLLWLAPCLLRSLSLPAPAAPRSVLAAIALARPAALPTSAIAAVVARVRAVARVLATLPTCAVDFDRARTVVFVACGTLLLASCSACDGGLGVGAGLGIGAMARN